MIEELRQPKALMTARSVMVIVCVSLFGLAGLTVYRVGLPKGTEVKTSGQAAEAMATATVPASTTLDGTGPLPTPSMVPVDDHVGTIRGYIPRSVLLDTPAQPLKLGTGRVPVSGFEVRDKSGQLTGYFFSTGGFVDLVTAAEPAKVDSLVQNPLQLIDSTGTLVSFTEWQARVRAGTARTR